MFDSDIAVVKQFLAGATKGPIGMSEEADERKGDGVAGVPAVSTSGMTAEQVEELERGAGAPDEGGAGAGTSPAPRDRAGTSPAPQTREAE
jgi:hypothetical protein